MRGAQALIPFFLSFECYLLRNYVGLGLFKKKD